MSQRQGSYLKKCRIEKGFSCQQLANCIGVSRMTLVRAESNGIKRACLIRKIAKVLEISPSYLLELDYD